MHRKQAKTYFFFAFTMQLFLICPANAQPPCSSNPSASDFCSSATPICNLNGYCGNTSSSYTNYVSSSNHTSENNTPLGNIFCAGIQNNSWLKFIADSTTAIFNIWVSDCNKGYGIQMQIYSTNNCYNFTSKSNCWNPGTQTNGQIVASNLTPGNVYYFMIDGSHGDVCDYVIAAKEGVNTTPVITGDQEICVGQSVSLSASGGTIYSWSSSPADPSLNGQTTASSITVSPQQTTTYFVTITKAGSNSFCPNNTTTLSTKVTVNPVPEFTLTSTADHCNLEDGTATVHLSDSDGVYSYSWNTSPSFQTTGTATHLATNTYTVTVTNQYACSTADTISVPFLNYLEPQIQAPEVLCFGTSCDLTVENIYATYNWSTGANTNSIHINDGGLYYVDVTYNTCTGSDTVFLPVDTVPVPEITGPEFICNGKTDILTISDIYDHQLWSTGGTGTTLNITQGGTYSVIASDTFNCTASSSIYVIQKYGPKFNITTENEICDRKNGTALIEITSSNGNVIYFWSTGDTTSFLDSLAAGTYYLIVTDSFCSTESEVEIKETPGPHADFRFTPLLPEYYGDNVNVDFYDMSSGTVINWIWDFGDTTANEFSQNTSHYYKNSGIYPVSLIVGDTNNCLDTALKALTIIDEMNLYIPNAFSPNSDGSNDVFYAQAYGVNPNDFNMWIFNRWGEELFHTSVWIDTQSEAWDGTKENSGETVVPGVYVYRILIRDQKGELHEFNGHILLLR